MAVFQIWREKDGITCAEFQVCLIHFARGIMNPKTCELVATFEANTPLEMSTKQYAIMGWGKYHPMKEEGAILAFYFKPFDDGDVA